MMNRMRRVKDMTQMLTNRQNTWSRGRTNLVHWARPKIMETLSTNLVLDHSLI